MNLSVCIIAKNEEKNIRRCLESLKSYNFEIVVVDTGSTDDTEKIAQQYTDRVYLFRQLEILQYQKVPKHMLCR